MPITRTPGIDDDGSGTLGTIVNNAWQTGLYDQIDAYVGGTWVDVAYNPATYFASAGATWVPAQAIYRYVVHANKTFTVQLYLSPGTLTGSAATLSVYTPIAGLTPNHGGTFYYYAGGGEGAGFVSVNASGAQLDFLRGLSGAPWSTSAPYIMCNLTLRLT